MAETAGLVKYVFGPHTPCNVTDNVVLTKMYCSPSVEDDGRLTVFSIRAYSSKPQCNPESCSMQVVHSAEGDIYQSSGQKAAAEPCQNQGHELDAVKMNVEQ